MRTAFLLDFLLSLWRAGRAAFSVFSIEILLICFRNGNCVRAADLSHHAKIVTLAYYVVPPHTAPQSHHIFLPNQHRGRWSRQESSQENMGGKQMPKMSVISSSKTETRSKLWLCPSQDRSSRCLLSNSQDDDRCHPCRGGGIVGPEGSGRLPASAGQCRGNRPPFGGGQCDGEG